ncbi:hypothetical protein ACPV3A_16855 [Paenibacillus sp. Dod16]|uniref:hypothetical protein n=1 Tax=Paenibacillus sp. Dod16 TaxID=3416392 RepID=UPI003CF967F3
MSILESLKQQFINKEIDKDTFYSDVSSYLANRTRQEYETAVNEVVTLINELQLTKIQANKIWSRAKIKYKMINNR